MINHLSQITPIGGPDGAPAPLWQVNNLFGNVVFAVVGFSGIALFVMLIMGGFSYITAAGDPKKAESARNTITFAIGGVVFIAVAFLILRFVALVTGTPALTNFTIFRR